MSKLPELLDAALLGAAGTLANTDGGGPSDALAGRPPFSTSLGGGDSSSMEAT